MRVAVHRGTFQARLGRRRVDFRIRMISVFCVVLGSYMMVLDIRRNG